MKPRFFAAFVFAALVCFNFVYADETDGADSDRAIGGSTPYQIPQTIYIGDHGRLVYPLNGFFFNQEEAVPKPAIASEFDGEENYADIIINELSIVDDAAGGGLGRLSAEASDMRLIVDFQVFKTGIVQIPPIVIAGETLQGLEVQVSSILEESGDLTILSPAEQPLNAPGTIWIITSIVLTVIFIVAFLFLFVFKGSAFLSDLKRKLRNRRIIHQTQKSIKKLKINLDKKNIGARAALDGIATELRLFLDNYFNIHCLSMSPPEFLKLSFPASCLAQEYSANYFYEFFMKCDTIRFSGAAVSEEAVREIIVEVETLVAGIRPEIVPDRGGAAASNGKDIIK
jgi:hypothetical protein